MRRVSSGSWLGQFFISNRFRRDGDDDDDDEDEDDDWDDDADGDGIVRSLLRLSPATRQISHVPFLAVSKGLRGGCGPGDTSMCATLLTDRFKGAGRLIGGRMFLPVAL